MSSFDLYPEEIDNRIAGMPGRKSLDPGAFDNFIAGTGKVGMQTVAKAASAVDLLGSVGPIIQDKFAGGTDAQDRYFREHDETFGRAVDYWAPKPGEVGTAGQVVGTLLGTLPLVMASPALAVGATQLSTGEDLVKKGVDAGKAQQVGAVQAVGLGLGIWMPVLGKTLTQRVLLGGAGFNVAQGTAMRGISGEILEGTPAAEDFKAFDPAMLTLDLLLGAAFGGLAHKVPAMRAEGEAWHARLAEWGAKLKPSDIDALLVMRQAQHINADSMPGKPVDFIDADNHVQRLRKAIDDMANDRPVQVEDMPQPRFEVDDARANEANALLDSMRQEADALVDARAIEPQEVGAGNTAFKIEDAAPNVLKDTPETSDQFFDSVHEFGGLRTEYGKGVVDAIKSQYREYAAFDEGPDLFAALFGDQKPAKKLNPSDWLLQRRFDTRGLPDVPESSGRFITDYDVSMIADMIQLSEFIHGVASNNAFKMLPPQLRNDSIGYEDTGSYRMRDSLLKGLMRDFLRMYGNENMGKSKIEEGITNSVDDKHVAEGVRLGYEQLTGREIAARFIKEPARLVKAARRFDEYLKDNAEAIDWEWNHMIEDLGAMDQALRAREYDATPGGRREKMHVVKGDGVPVQEVGAGGTAATVKESLTADPNTIPDDTQYAGLDPLTAEAYRFADSNPELRIEIGRDANGEAITTTPKGMLEQAELDLRGAQEDAKLFQIAAACLLGAT